jgi:hypothetical protein
MEPAGIRAGMAIPGGKSWARATGTQVSVLSDSMTLLSVLYSMFAEQKRQRKQIAEGSTWRRLHNNFAFATLIKSSAINGGRTQN